MSTAHSRQPDLQPQVEHACTICGGSEHEQIASAQELEAQRRYLRLFHRRRLRTSGDASLEERADFTQDYSTNIVKCRDCGLLFRDPRPSDDAITQAYEQDTYGAERLSALFDSQLELFRPKARRLKLWLERPDPVVLEIGSFVGGFLAACAELGWHAVGIDPGQEVADFCEARGLSVLRENVDDCEFPRAAADCVAVWNTFDQLPDPHPMLRSAQRCLRKDGLLILRVPSGACFEACMRRLRRWPPPARRVLLAAMAWNNLLSFPYLHGYAPATLDRLLGQYGFVRVHEHGDVLTRLSDEQTRSWAAWEERILKGGWRALAAARPDDAAMPWIDLYFRAQGKSGLSTTSGSGLSGSKLAPSARVARVVSGLTVPPPEQ